MNQMTQRHGLLHPACWAAWLLAGVTCVLLTSNPLYLATLGLCALAVYAAWRRPERRALDGLLLVSIGIALLTLPLNLATGSSGATVLCTLPEIVLPGWLASVRFGGDVTAESMLFALARALGLIAIISMVCAFNAGVDHFRLLRLVPASMTQLGIILTVGVVLVPETIARASALREARIVRGHGGGVGTYIALLLPLLSEALERSVQRAESLDARGFGRLAAQGDPRTGVLVVACVAGAALAFFASYYVDYGSLLLAGGGVLGLIAVVIAWRHGGDGAVRMRRAPLLRPDIIVLAASAAALLTFLALRQFGVGGLSYLPFPEVAIPEFGAIAAGGMLMLAIPALFAGERRPL